MDDMRFEDIWRSGTHTMGTANIAPLLSAIWDKARWSNSKEVISAKIVAGETDPHAIDDDQPFISRVEGTSRAFQCNVPIYNPQGELVYCGHQVQRRDRILRHVKDSHLSYRPFVCVELSIGIVLLARFGADTD